MGRLVDGDIPLTPVSAILLFLVAVAGGALNALSGGGTFIVFPSLLLHGLPAVPANATTTVALWPGVVSSALAYRAELRYTAARLAFALAFVSVIGSVLGAQLLLHTPSRVFEGLVPFLLLFAILVFAFGPAITRRIGHSGKASSRRGVAGLIGAMLAVQFAIAVYGGYFGGGIGIIMLAAFGFFGMNDFHQANALRTFLAACINTVAALSFILAGAVFWPEASIMLVGSIIGGYSGVHVLRRVPPFVLRRTVVVAGLLMTAYLFARSYLPM